jgi:hypothetical protein
MSPAFSKRTFYAFSTFNHCFRLSHQAPWTEAKIISLPKPRKEPKLPQNVRPSSLLSTTGKLFEKLILRTIQKHIEERNLLKASQFGFRSDHSAPLQCKGLADHINNMSTAAVLLDIKKAFDKTWHSGLLYKLSELDISTSLVKLISSVLTNRKFKLLVEGEFSKPRNIAVGVPQGSVLAPVLYSLYINDAPEAPRTHLALYANDTCIYATEDHERRVFRNSQRGLTAVKS